MFRVLGIYNFGFTEDLRMTIYDSEICIVLVSNDVVYLFIILLEWGGTSWCCNYCVHFTIWHLSISSSRFIWRKQHFLLNCLSTFITWYAKSRTTKSLLAVKLKYVTLKHLGQRFHSTSVSELLLISLQVVLCQKYSFLYQLSHNMTIYY